MSTTIKKEAKNLEYATQMHKALLWYSHFSWIHNWIYFKLQIVLV
jgi:hypothetical protein